MIPIARLVTNGFGSTDSAFPKFQFFGKVKEDFEGR